MAQNDEGMVRGGAEYTGRTLLLLAEDDAESAISELEDRAGVHAVLSRDLKGSGERESMPGSIVFEELGVAVVEGDPDQTQRIAVAAGAAPGRILASEPERVVYALSLQSPEIALPPGNGHQRMRAPAAFQPTVDKPQEIELPALAGAEDIREFLRGYREAVAHIETLLGQQRAAAVEPLQALDFAPTAEATWGLNVTRAIRSRFSGRGIRLAVLDTGMDFSHPDFAGRTIQRASFIAGEAAQDGHGHGTHCIGTSCGPRAPLGGVPRYGVAHGAEIYVGKVLSNAGSGSDSGILAGIDWALKNRCAIISMSLGARVEPGAPYSTIYETVARRAAAKGAVIIAAAGNESSRPGYLAPVGHPANCPSVIAVGALDERLNIASFSCAGLSGAGGEVNVAGPGVNVFSSWPLPTRYRSISGTSMATPHVAGIAALYAEATGLRGFPLINEMLRRSRRLAPVRDFGWGLVQSA